MTDLYINPITHGFEPRGIYAGYSRLFIPFVGTNVGNQESNSLSLDKGHDKDKVLEDLSGFKKFKIQSVSLMGGEPLLQVNGLKELLFIIQMVFKGTIFHIYPAWVSYMEQT